MPRARARSPRLASAEGVGVALMVNITVGCQWALKRDSYQ
jgi:hypothetical protein